MVTDTVGSVFTMTYDLQGRKTAMDDPDMGEWAYTYDAAGNLSTQTDAMGQVITFTYDLLNRVTEKAYSSGEDTVTYGYDDCISSADATAANSWGWLRKVYVGSENANRHLYRYDDRGRPRKKKRDSIFEIFDFD